MFKKLLMLTVVVAMVAALALTLISCNEADDGLPRIEFMFMENTNAAYDKDWLVFQEFERIRGVKLDVLPIPGSDYGQKRNTVFASGQIPDIMVNCWPGEMTQFAMDGLLTPISDYAGDGPDLFMPELKARIDEWEIGRASCRERV